MTVVAEDADLTSLEQSVGAVLADAHPDRVALRLEQLEPITGGYSCRMYRADISWDESGAPMRESVVVRADPPAGQSMIPVTRDHEYAVLSSLAGSGLAAPAVRYCDVAATRLGVQVTVMEFLSGRPVNEVLAGGVTDAHVDALADLSADIALVPVESLPASVTRPAGPDAWFYGMIQLWRDLEAAHPESLPFFRYAAGWLEKHRPAPAPLTLLHGDFCNANLMLVDDVLYAVDWDLSSIGDPRADLGYYRLYAKMAPPDVIAHDPQRFCARYRERTGMSEEVINPTALSYFEVLGNVLQLRVFLPGVGAYCAGLTSNLQLPYNMANAVSMLQGSWLTVLGELEQQMAAIG